MSIPVVLDHHYTENGLHFTRANEEFLTLLFSGEVIVRTRLPDGSQHIHSEQWPKLLPWILTRLRSSSGDFWVGTHRLPKKTHRRIRIRSVITLFVVDSDQYPLVLTREPLDSRGVNELLQRLPPCLALLNAGQVYLNPNAPYARPNLA
jgi:hypothetical protein